MKGNVLDMAVGVIIGGAFGKIVTSMVNDVLMPVVGTLTGGIDFTDLFINLSNTESYKTLAAAKEAGVNTFAYGMFLQNVVDFLIVAFCIFCMIKGINRVTGRLKDEPAPAPEPPAPAPTREEELLAEIRDLLAKQEQKKQ